MRGWRGDSSLQRIIASSTYTGAVGRGMFGGWRGATLVGVERGGGAGSRASEWAKVFSRASGVPRACRCGSPVLLAPRRRGETQVTFPSGNTDQGVLQMRECVGANERNLHAE